MLSIFDSGGLSIFGDTRRSSGDFVFEPSELATSVEIGRGDTDTDITYLKLRNADAEDCYMYPNATQDAWTVSNAKP